MLTGSSFHGDKAPWARLHMSSVLWTDSAELLLVGIRDTDNFRARKAMPLLSLSTTLMGIHISFQTLNRKCNPGGHYREYYPSALSLCEVTGHQQNQYLFSMSWFRLCEEDLVLVTWRKTLRWGSFDVFRPTYALMVVAGGLAPYRHQGLSNHHDDPIIGVGRQSLCLHAD